MGDKLIEIIDVAKCVLLSDHHDSTPITLHKHADVINNKYKHKFSTYVDISKAESGATLAWKLTHKGSIPPLVEIVRIGDNWQWQDYPRLQARHVLAALKTKKTFKSFLDIERTFISWDKNFSKYVKAGKEITKYKLAMVKQIGSQCDLGFIQTNDGNVYNVAYVQCNVLHSDVGSSMRWYA